MPKKKRKTAAPQTILAGLTLLDIDVAFDPEFETAENPELNYNVEITPPEHVRDDLFAFTTEVVISKSVKDEDNARTAIRVSYLCGMRGRDMEDNDIVSYAMKYAQTTVWANFAMLATIIVQQMGAQFPMFPPNALTVVLGEAADDSGDDNATHTASSQ
jgi:hypothetical protein